MNASTETVLVLDGNSRAALATVRSLGKAGYKVIVGSHKKSSLAFSSKYISASVIYPDPYKDKVGFTSWLLNYLENNEITFLLPVANTTLGYVAANANQLSNYTTIPIESEEKISKVNNKSWLTKKAEELDILTPKSATLNTENIDNINLSEFTFPVVVKPIFSDYLKGNASLTIPVSYATSEKEVANIVSKHTDISFIVQEKIVGTGIGVSLLAQDGEVKNLFCHRRILEKPPSGGVSVLSESIDPKAAPVDQAKSLIRSLSYSGIAMVEFKKCSTTNEFYLIEINPRFWGSLNLAISCGIPFPNLLLKQYGSNLSSLNVEDSYPANKKMRWILGTFDHLLISLKQDFKNAVCNMCCKNSLRILNNISFYDVFNLKDIKPFLRELIGYFNFLAK